MQIVSSDNVGSTLYKFDRVAEDIADVIKIEKNYYYGKIKINLSCSNIDDKCIRELAEFISQNKFLCKKLAKLDFSRNRLTSKSFASVKDIINCCPKVYINLSKNNFSNNEVHDLISSGDRIMKSIVWIK